MDHLKEKLTDYRITYIVVSHENHDDGGDHVHAAILLGRKLETRQNNFFDTNNFHPNIQSARRFKDVVEYIKKDDDFIEFGEFHSNQDAPRRQRLTAEGMDACANKEEFMEYVRQNDTGRYIFNHAQLVSFADLRYRQQVPEYESRYEFNVSDLPERIRTWHSEQFSVPRPERPLTLVLMGGTRLGKTTWARSLGPHIYLAGSINVRKMKEQQFKDYLVVDDVPFEKFIGFKQLIGAQLEFELTDRYLKKVTFENWSKPCIVCLNEDMDYEPKMDRHLLAWYNENTIQVQLFQPLF